MDDGRDAGDRDRGGGGAAGPGRAEHVPVRGPGIRQRALYESARSARRRRVGRRRRARHGIARAVLGDDQRARLARVAALHRSTNGTGADPRPRDRDSGAFERDGSIRIPGVARCIVQRNFANRSMVDFVFIGIDPRPTSAAPGYSSCSRAPTDACCARARGTLSPVRRRPSRDAGGAAPFRSCGRRQLRPRDRPPVDAVDAAVARIITSPTCRTTTYAEIAASRPAAFCPSPPARLGARRPVHEKGVRETVRDLRRANLDERLGGAGDPLRNWSALRAAIAMIAAWGFTPGASGSSERVVDAQVRQPQTRPKLSAPVRLWSSPIRTVDVRCTVMRFALAAGELVPPGVEVVAAAGDGRPR